MEVVVEWIFQVEVVGVRTCVVEVNFEWVCEVNVVGEGGLDTWNRECEVCWYVKR